MTDMIGVAVFVLTTLVAYWALGLLAGSPSCQTDGPILYADCFGLSSETIDQLHRLVRDNVAVFPRTVDPIFLTVEQATEWAGSEEMKSYIAQSPLCVAQIRGDADSRNACWGLPELFKGRPIVVKDCRDPRIDAMSDRVWY
jgi:hypothetical protein